MLLKLAIAETVAVIAAGTSTIDGTANRVILYSAAFAGAAWLWAHFLAPLAKIIRRTVRGVEQLEQIPALNEKVATIDERSLKTANEVAAIARDLDIKTRHPR